MPKITYEELVKYCEKNNCKILTSAMEYKYITGRKRISIISSCNHQLDNVKLYDFYNNGKHIICNKCTILKESNRYSILAELCYSKDCILTTTEEEFNNMVRKDKMNIVSSCGHPSYNVNISLFKMRDQLIICKDCISEKRKNFNNNNCEFNSMEYEKLSISIIKDNLKNIVLEKTVEGCNADVIVQPKNINEKLWLPLQVKSTLNKQKSGYYSFSIHKNYYENTIIILVAITDKKIWLMDNNIVNGKDKIALGGKESIYNKYEVKIEELDNKILEFYNNYSSYHISQKKANIPTSDSQQLEHKFRLLRKEKLSYLNFVDPDTNNITYDFMINNFKVQEKVAVIKKETSGICCGYVATLRKHSGKSDNNPTESKRGLTRKQSYTCYKQGDNDYYWISLPNSTIFFVISEEELIKKNIVESKNKKEAKLYIPDPSNIITKVHWLINYMYDYNEDNKETLLSLFENDVII